MIGWHDLKPAYIVDAVRDLVKRLIVVRGDDASSREVQTNATLNFSVHLRATFASPKVLEQHHLTREAFDWAHRECPPSKVLNIPILNFVPTQQAKRRRALIRAVESLSIKQGLTYDAPQSAADIPGFIELDNLKVDEISNLLDSFKAFNEFFYRKLKKSARPIEQPDNPYRLVSAADCRMMAFETVSDAACLWIKGCEFTVARLLGDVYRAEADKYTGGALAIFRLAPQDYHHFHSPVDDTIGPMTYIDGEYYTVNPQAIRTALDVYGENVHKIVPIDSPQFGRVMAVCIGAMMVGSIETTVNEGDFVKRGDEFGYFAFGGSTIVILFEKGAVKWDEDPIINGKASLETLVRVGMGIGTGRMIFAINPGPEGEAQSFKAVRDPAIAKGVVLFGCVLVCGHASGAQETYLFKFIPIAVGH
ncbi:hypothetical protein BDN71DRAFT_1513724 [Pleurotus eryngii]|uniref:phosphatidylserine decarboxylase n=1 Tax=Pleurotus eryngii TaxID=5323 RepID=A0A9P5ZJD0_PLEER|nr:hypothetical protein BDN71DRAFT_1513724 [Pleurotus eryngii]